MTEYEIPLPSTFDPGVVERLVESVCVAVGLTVTMKGTLRTYLGSTHWHFKRGREAGVLEVTFWPTGNRLWLSVQAGRAGEWTAIAASDLAKALARILRTHYDAP